MKIALGNFCKHALPLVLGLLAAGNTAAELIFTTLQYQNTSTELRDINANGVIVGNASPGSDSLPFLYANGSFSTFNALVGTEFRAISDTGVIVGQRFTTSPTQIGGGVIIENGTVIDFAVPGSVSGTTSLTSISPNGRYLTGSYTATATSQRRSFVFDRLSGTLTDIAEGPFELYFETAWDVTNAGLVAVSEAFLFTSIELQVTSYLYDVQTGQRIDIDSDGNAPNYQPGGLNALGQLTGTYYPSIITDTTLHGFYGSINDPLSALVVFDVPGSVPPPAGGVQTVAWGIDERGTFVGSFQSADGFRIGYIATQVAAVPEPNTASLLGLALGALVLNRRRRPRL